MQKTHGQTATLTRKPEGPSQGSRNSMQRCCFHSKTCRETFTVTRPLSPTIMSGCPCRRAAATHGPGHGHHSFNYLPQVPQDKKMYRWRQKFKAVTTSGRAVCTDEGEKGDGLNAAR